MNSLDVLTLFLFNIVIYNIPLLYGTVGEIIIEKSGSLNLGVEGIMAVGAIFGYLIGCSANSLTVGILASFICAGLFGIIFAVLTVTMQANQNVTGLTMTTFGVGLFFFIGKGLSASWPVMTQYANINNGFKNPIEIPLLSKIPVLGKALFSHNILVYLGIFIAIAVWFYLNKTKAGLRLRAIGENPAAADSLGINITLYKYVHIILGSGIMGIGGYYMGLNLGGSFEGSNCWINGYGWIAVALVIFANWNTLAAILGTLVFGFFNTLQIYSGSLAYAFPKALGFLDKIPSQLYQALPFIITALVLIFSSVRKNNKSAQPASLGLNYYREER
ncbi:MAG: ABC transporter permease [Ruminococcus sp.]|nr:ABC transporter permease [Ruminococcus sp.]